VIEMLAGDIDAESFASNPHGIASVDAELSAVFDSKSGLESACVAAMQALRREQHTPTSAALLAPAPTQAPTAAPASAPVQPPAMLAMGNMMLAVCLGTPSYLSDLAACAACVAVHVLTD